MNDNKDHPFYLDQDKLIAGVAALGDWLDKHGPYAAYVSAFVYGEPPESTSAPAHIWLLHHKTIPPRITKLYHRVRKYRKHGERRGVVRRKEALIGNVEW